MTIYYIPGPNGEKPKGTPIGAFPIDLAGTTPSPLKSTKPAQNYHIPSNILRAFAGLDPTPEPVYSSQPARTPITKQKGGLEQHFL